MMLLKGCLSLILALLDAGSAHFTLNSRLGRRTLQRRLVLVPSRPTAYHVTHVTRSNSQGCEGDRFPEAFPSTSAIDGCASAFLVACASASSSTKMALLDLNLGNAVIFYIFAPV